MYFKPEECAVEAMETTLLLGLSVHICPVCKAHLKEVSPGRLICLNACHLGPDGMRRFQQYMAAALTPQKEVKG